MKTDILLESGTNEIEIMQFTIMGELYGINVAKVKEIMMSQAVKPIPHSNRCVEGIYKPRNEIMTVIDLTAYLKEVPTVRDGRDIFIITSFNQMNIAFHVESVQFISRISWQDIQKADNTVNNGKEGIATGIAQCNGQLVTILDFEKIVAEIAPMTSINVSDIDSLGARGIMDEPIVIAEDSILLTELIKQSLDKAGFTNLKFFGNGLEAFEYLENLPAENLEKEVKLVITDIEMPQMDGHRLTKLIKTNNKLKHLPVVIFSSLINEEMRAKGTALGADAQLSKPEIGSLIRIIDNLITGG